MSFISGRSRWSDVWLATAARGIASCGDFLVASALTLALQSAGAGGLAVSGVLLAATLPLVVLAPLTGRLADRVDSRTILVAAGLAQAGICLALAYAEHPALVIVLVALLAAGLAATQPVISALVPVMVRAADLPRASALNQSAGTLGALAGPALAGLLVGQFGARPPLLLAAGSYLALVVAGLLIRTRRGGRRRAEPALPGGAVPATGWRLCQDPLLVAMVASVAGVIGAVGAINVVEVFFIRETLGSSTTVYGLVTGAWTLGILAGGWLFARVVRRLDRDGALVGAGLALLGGCCLMVLASAAVPAALLLVPIFVVGGVFNGGNNVFDTVLLARRVPEAARGRAFAFFGASVQGAAMVGYLAGGLLLEVAAPRPLVAACGVAGLVVVAAVALPLRRASRAATPAVLEPAPAGPPPLAPDSVRGELEPAGPPPFASDLGDPAPAGPPPLAPDLVRKNPAPAGPA
ncbi:Predicted arabinose efflux permease, MFS family [Micromonospora echinaurantiaca]|uniref:Predicted arabinose efflux permease, MFS family n=1 Tax=Micromonospora echinaurantiaca TaxID=47857 RepID=A0A1C5KCB8_9ACTN|nr:MFS transporter [Micromonospora echinaurantiaca]SCG80046.1 Predicted arabinose efflux permease, MFS family [Micromonospora echinaurantiaca]